MTREEPNDRPAQDYTLDVSAATAAQGAVVEIAVPAPGGEEYVIAFDLPPGVLHGQWLRLRGVAPGGGDIKLQVCITPDR